MRYGIFSDVHANLEALRVVLDHLQTQRIDEYVFLGDAVGYGASPDEVCELIRPLVKVAIIGNHDAAACGRIDYSDYYDAARDALDWTGRRLSDANRAWLRALPYQVRAGDALFTHGAPVCPEAFEYLIAPDQLEMLGGSYQDLAPVTFIGHSHLTVCFRVSDSEVEPYVAGSCDVTDGDKHIITVGSVGQPRDRDPRASCGVYDTVTGVFTYHRLEYDVAVARQKILDAGLPSVFAERLLVGM